MAVAGQGLLTKGVCALTVHTPLFFAELKVDFDGFFALTQRFRGRLIGFIIPSDSCRITRKTPQNAQFWFMPNGS